MIEQKNKKYVYFVSYQTSVGIRNGEFKLDSIFLSIDDIERLEEYISSIYSKALLPIIINNFQLLRTEDI